jgi:hypothetical protein
MDWATFWAIFSQTHLVTLLAVAVGASELDIHSSNYLPTGLAISWTVPFLPNSCQCYDHFFGDFDHFCRTVVNVMITFFGDLTISAAQLSKL